MRLKRAFALLAIISLSGLFACDFYPGSSYQTRQSMRTWAVLDAQSGPACLPLGSYTFTQDLMVPDWNGNWRLSLRPLNRQDRNNLPLQTWIQYDLNDQFFFQVNFDLKSGRGSSRVWNQAGINFNSNDRLDMWFCAGDGFIPIETRVDWSERLRFPRLTQQF